MITTEKTMITVEASINAPVEKVWNLWTEPKHIIHWNYASDDWHTPRATNDLKVGGSFLSHMEARDGSMGFDFSGKYTKVVLCKLIEYTMDDGRKAKISFVADRNETFVTETFEAEQTNTLELQKGGWQSILNNFKKYVEKSARLEILHFEITIDAGVEKVYKNMFDEKKWKEWTSEFNPTSHFIGSWEKGSEILFLGTDENGKTGGMKSRIKVNIPNKYVCIEHLNMIRDGKEITGGNDADLWTGALENYTFTENNGTTLLSVELDSNQQFKSYFINTWPKALNKLKATCEK